MTTGPTPFGPSSPRSPSSQHSGSSCGPSSEPTATNEKHTPRSSNNSARNETILANSHRRTTSETRYLNAGNVCRKQIPANVNGGRTMTGDANSPETIVFGGSSAARSLLLCSLASSAGDFGKRRWVRGLACGTTSRTECETTPQTIVYGGRHRTVRLLNIFLREARGSLQCRTYEGSW